MVKLFCELCGIICMVESNTPPLQKGFYCSRCVNQAKAFADWVDNQVLEKLKDNI